MAESTTETKVAVLAASDDQRQHLQTMLERSGLDVVVNEVDGDAFLDKLKGSTAEVMLIDVGESEEDDLDVIDNITEQSDLPILFNDSGPEGVNLATSGDMWAKKLAQKLSQLAQGSQEKGPASSAELPHPMVNQGPTGVTAPRLNTTPSPVTAQLAGASSTNSVGEQPSSESIAFKTSPQEEDAAAENQDLNVWVLGASLGGPQAVRQFLSSISPELPVVFILAQHIGANHVNLLAEQLNRVTPFNVVPGKSGHKLRHHEVILTPADKQISFTSDGYIALQPSPPAAVYSPSIDLVMNEVAKQYGAKAGTIVFSGMGDDGAKGCEAIADNGGIVWAQDVASCVVSSMPDQARKSGKVSYSANPEQLASQLFEYFNVNSH